MSSGSRYRRLRKKYQIDLLRRDVVLILRRRSLGVEVDVSRNFSARFIFSDVVASGLRLAHGH